MQTNGEVEKQSSPNKKLPNTGKMVRADTIDLVINFFFFLICINLQSIVICCGDLSQVKSTLEQSDERNAVSSAHLSYLYKLVFAAINQFCLNYFQCLFSFSFFFSLVLFFIFSCLTCFLFSFFVRVQLLLWYGISYFDFMMTWN